MSQPMMWVFAVLIVLAMGGIAMLAAGRGVPMARSYDDRPDADVPADRPLGPDDLRRVRFSLAFRGYRMSEVDTLLARVALEMRHRELAAGRADDAVPDAPTAPGTERTTDPATGPATGAGAVPPTRPGEPEGESGGKHANR